LIPLLLALTSAVYFLSDNEADNDLWIHLLTGREIVAAGALPTADTWSFTSAGTAWVDHEWLAQILFAFAFARGGDTGIWLLKVVVGLITAMLLWRMIARRTMDPWIRAVVLTLALAVIGRGFAMRPQIFTYLSIAILLNWLDRRQREETETETGTGTERAIKLRSLSLSLSLSSSLRIAALFAFWANAHGGFVFGLGVLGLYLALPPWRGWSARAALFVVASVATCINPYGASLITYIAHELQTAHPITEWQAAAASDPALFSYFVLLGAFAVSIPFTTSLRRRLWWMVLAVITMVMSLRHQRHAPLLALCAAPLLAEQLANSRDWLQRRTAFTLSDASMRVIALAVAAIVVLQLVLLGTRLANDGPHVVYDAREYPVDAMHYLQRESLTGNLAVPLDWGGYVLWHGRPNVRVSLDGRFATVYPPAAVTANFAFYGEGTPGDAARLIDDYGATIVLSPAGWRTPVHGRPDWTVRYRDDVAEILTHESGAPTVVGQAARGRVRFP
jgi:hypothetical protein